MFIVEDVPNTSKSANKSAKPYGGSKTSRFDYPDLSSHTSSATGGYGASSYTKPASSSSYPESNKYEPPSYSVYSAATPKHASERGANKSRFTKKKYGGAKTSYGDIGGVSFANPGSTSHYDMYKKHETNNKYPPPKYDYTAKPKYGGSTTGYVSGPRYGAGCYKPTTTDPNK